MTPATRTQTPDQAAMHSQRHLLRHFAEMVVAMMVGMIVIGGAIRGAVAVVGLTYSTAGQPEFTALEMAADMAIAMTVWMRLRGHGWPATLEMAGVMIAPAIALLPLLWVGVLTGESLMIAEHVVMLPLMYVVMLRRRDEYGAPSHV
jgi:hypothetical protein